MNRQKFMSELEVLLQDIPENDRLDAIAYYNDYFDEAGKENEELIIRELGSPKKVADTIKNGMVFGEDTDRKDNCGEYTERGYFEGRSANEWKANREFERGNYPISRPKKNIPWIAIVVLLILASPVVIGVFGGLFGGLVGLIGGLIGVTVGTAGGGFGIFIGGLVCFVVGFIRLFSNPLEGLTSMGVGALLIAIGILLILLFVLLVSKWIPALVKGFIGGCKYVYHKVIGLVRRDRL